MARIERYVWVCLEDFHSCRACKNEDGHEFQIYSRLVRRLTEAEPEMTGP
jgi:hypothetical protein